MSSDFELMGKSGGMIGQTPQSMKVPVTLHPEGIIRPQPAPEFGPPAMAVPEPQPSRGHGKAILITALVIVGVLGLLALGYFVLGK